MTSLDATDAEAQLQATETPAQRETLGLFWRAAHMIEADLTDAALHSVLTYIFDGEYDQYQGNDIPREVAGPVLKRTGHFLFAGAYSTAVALRVGSGDEHPMRKPEFRAEIMAGLYDRDMNEIPMSDLDDHMVRHLAEHITASVILRSALRWEWNDAFDVLKEHTNKFGLHSTISITGDMLRLFRDAQGLKVIGGEPLDSPDG